MQFTIGRWKVAVTRSYKRGYRSHHNRGWHGWAIWPLLIVARKDLRVTSHGHESEVW